MKTFSLIANGKKEKMQYRTRSGRSPQGLQRVFFTGHPDRLEYWREQIIPQILERQDCAVFYESDPEHPEDAENFETDLARMQLIVIPVTNRFLTQDSFARRVVFAFAMERHIPVLPVLTEPGLEDLFNKVCGDLQCLDMTLHDGTALPFDEKLTRYLNSVLIGDETAQKIRDAFDAYIFMSYRKKDRKFAQELMRLIHKNEFCRDIAIWYDEFLVPGESFNNAIQDALKKSELFTLVVTPNLLEQGNYVMQHEYPDAKDAGMKILPAELQKTDRSVLEQHFDAIPPCVDSHNVEALGKSLAALLADVTNPDNNRGEDPVHDFFIGLAYLGGIDVETDYVFALELITRAAEHELPEAMHKLVDMYHNGEGVQRDYHKAIEWQRRLTALRGRLFAEEPDAENGAEWFYSLSYLGDALADVGKLAEAQSEYDRMLRCSEKLLAYRFIFAQRSLSVSYSKLGNICQLQGRLAEAQQYFEKSLQMDEQIAAQTGTIEARIDLSCSYESLGDVCQAYGRLPEAQQYYEKSLNIREQLAAETGTAAARRHLCSSYHNLGRICEVQSRLSEAQQYYEKCLHICEQLAEESRTVDTVRSLATAYENLGNIRKANGRLPEAEQYYEKCLHIREQLAVETGTVQARRNLSVSNEKLDNICEKQRRLPEAWQYYEKCLTICEQLADETGTIEARRDLSVSFSKLGGICKLQGRLPEAWQYFENCLHICEQIAEETGTVEAACDLIACCNNLGDICEAQGRLQEAWQYFEKSLHFSAQLADETGTVEARSDLSYTCCKLGDIWKAQGRIQEAQQYFEKSLQIAEQLADETGTAEERRSLFVSSSRLGEICEAQGRLPEAWQYYENCLTICAQLADETGSIYAWDDLALSYYHLGHVSEDQMCRKEFYSQALKIWEMLAEQCPDNPEFAGKRNMAKEALEKL